MNPLIFAFEFHFATAVAILVIFNLTFSYWTLKFYYTRDTPHRESLIDFFFAMALGVLVFFVVFGLSIVFTYFAFPNLQASLWLLNLQQSKFVVIFLIPVIEELLKASMYLYLDRKKDIRSPLDALTYGAIIGSGFATFENIMYGISTLISGNFTAALTLTGLRATALVVGHPLYTGLFAVGVAYKKAGIKQQKLPRIFISIFLHITWNLLVLLQFVIHIPLPFYVSFSISALVILAYSLILASEISTAKSIERKLLQMGIDPRINRFIIRT